MSNVKSITAREILTADATPTVETTVLLEDNSIGTAACPLSSHLDMLQKVTISDKDPNRYSGNGALKAVEIIEKNIAPALIGHETISQQETDKLLIDLDGTQDRSILGANTTISVSMAIAKASAVSAKIPLYLYLKQFVPPNGIAPKTPTPIFSFLHGFPKETGLVNFEEFLIVPASSKTYSESLILATKLFASLQQILRENNVQYITTNAGGIAPKLPSNIDALSLLSKAFDRSSLRLGLDFFLGIDFRAENYSKGKQYKIPDKTQSLSANELSDYYQEIIKQYRILYLEDPFSNEDWSAWSSFTKKMSLSSLVTGDSITATNIYRLQTAIDKSAIGAVVVKPSQTGTVIEAMAFAEAARASSLKIVVSQRTKETNDDFIADFAIAVSADYVRFGSLLHGEHVAKYNRLSEIEKGVK